MTNIVYRNASATVVGSFAYRYDVLGLVMQKVAALPGGASVTNAYAYDGLGRLVSADGVSYTYDLTGNHLTQSVAGGATAVGFTYEHNRLTAVNRLARRANVILLSTSMIIHLIFGGLSRRFVDSA